MVMLAPPSAEEAAAMIPSQQASSRPLSLLPNNQVEHRAPDCDFARSEHRDSTKYYFVAPYPSARIPAVPLQLIEKVWLSGTFRVSVRMLGSRSQSRRRHSPVSKDRSVPAYFPT